MFKPLLLINNNITIHKTGDTNVVRKILCLQENSRTYFLESPAFLPGESGIFSWRVRHFFLESPVSFPGESGISSWRVRYLFLESPAFLPGESGIFPWRVLASQLPLFTGVRGIRILRTSPYQSSQKFSIAPSRYLEH